MHTSASDIIINKNNNKKKGDSIIIGQIIIDYLIPNLPTPPYDVSLQESGRLFRVPIVWFSCALGYDSRLAPLLDLLTNSINE